MTRNDLEQIHYLNRELHIWEKELERLNNRSLVQSPLPQIGSGSGISDRVGDKGAQTVDLETKIKQRKRLVTEVFNFIENIPDVEIRIIVRSHCKDNDSWNTTLKKVGNTATMDGIKKRYSRFLENNF